MLSLIREKENITMRIKSALKMKLPRNTTFTEVSFNLDGKSYCGKIARTNASGIVTAGVFDAYDVPPLRATGTLRGVHKDEVYAARYGVISLVKNGLINFKLV